MPDIEPIETGEYEPKKSSIKGVKSEDLLAFAAALEKQSDDLRHKANTLRLQGAVEAAELLDRQAERYDNLIAQRKEEAEFLTPETVEIEEPEVLVEIEPALPLPHKVTKRHIEQMGRRIMISAEAQREPRARAAAMKILELDDLIEQFEGQPHSEAILAAYRTNRAKYINQYEEVVGKAMLGQSI